MGLHCCGNTAGARCWTWGSICCPSTCGSRWTRCSRSRGRSSASSTCGGAFSLGLVPTDLARRRTRRSWPGRWRPRSPRRCRTGPRRCATSWPRRPAGWPCARCWRPSGSSSSSEAARSALLRCSALGRRIRRTARARPAPSSPRRVPAGTHSAARVSYARTGNLLLGGKWSRGERDAVHPSSALRGAGITEAPRDGTWRRCGTRAAAGLARPARSVGCEPDGSWVSGRGVSLRRHRRSCLPFPFTPLLSPRGAGPSRHRRSPRRQREAKRPGNVPHKTRGVASGPGAYDAGVTRVPGAPVARPAVSFSLVRNDGVTYSRRDRA